MKNKILLLGALMALPLLSPAQAKADSYGFHYSNAPVKVSYAHKKHVLKKHHYNKAEYIHAKKYPEYHASKAYKKAKAYKYAHQRLRARQTYYDYYEYCK